jgi:hypothetical protein
MLESGIVQLVMADAAVLALSTTGGFLLSLPKDETLPSWTYRVISDVSSYTLDKSHGFVERRLQIDCYGAKSAEAMNLARAIDKVLSGYQGTLTDADATYVHGCFRSDLMDMFDEANRSFRRMLEYEVQFRESQ